MATRDGLYVAPSPILNADRGRIIELAARYRLPAIYQWVEHVEDGGLMAYGANLRWAVRTQADPDCVGVSLWPRRPSPVRGYPS